MAKRTKFVMITGASRGIGLELASKILSGTSLGVIGISRSSGEALHKLRKKYPRRILLLEASISEPQGLRKIEKEIQDKDIFGLVHNAAVADDNLFVLQNNSVVEDMLRVNLLAPMLLSKVVLKKMLVARQGRIIFISSIAAFKGFKGLAVYGATKAGMIGFVKSLAREVGKRGVTVNAVAPGFIRTDINAHLTEAAFDRVAGRSALGAMLEKGDVVNATLYFLAETGARITGTTMVVDPGSL